MSLAEKIARDEPLNDFEEMIADYYIVLDELCSIISGKNYEKAGFNIRELVGMRMRAFREDTCGRLCLKMKGYDISDEKLETLRTIYMTESIEFGLEFLSKEKESVKNFVEGNY